MGDCKVPTTGFCIPEKEIRVETFWPQSLRSRKGEVCKCCCCGVRHRLTGLWQGKEASKYANEHCHSSSCEKVLLQCSMKLLDFFTFSARCKVPAWFAVNRAGSMQF